MIRLTYSNEAITDLLFMENNLNVCISGLTKAYPIIDVSMEMDKIIFILDDGEVDTTDMMLTYENPMYGTINHISKYDK